MQGQQDQTFGVLMCYGADGESWWPVAIYLDTDLGQRVAGELNRRAGLGSGDEVARLETVGHVDRGIAGAAGEGEHLYRVTFEYTEAFELDHQGGYIESFADIWHDLRASASDGGGDPFRDLGDDVLDQVRDREYVNVLARSPEHAWERALPIIEVWLSGQRPTSEVPA